MKIKLTIGLPTANRPDKLKDCLNSLKRHLSLPFHLIVIDSSSKDLQWTNPHNEDNITLIHPDEMLSPAHARKVIEEKCSTPFLLYLDDDMTIRPGSVESLLDHLKTNPNTDIVGGAVYEYGCYRDIGFTFYMGNLAGQNVVMKNCIRREWLIEKGFESFKVDFITQPPILVRTEIFKQVHFDKNYKWALEIWDFFMSCYKNGIHSDVLPNAIFDHFPAAYASDTFKSKKAILNKEGKEYFIKKWGMTPIKPLRRHPLIEFKNEWLMRRKRQKMVKNKIKVDGVKHQ